MLYIILLVKRHVKGSMYDYPEKKYVWMCLTLISKFWWLSVLKEIYPFDSDINLISPHRTAC